jgi:DNA-binding PadR family transcriptional regulator
MSTRPLTTTSFAILGVLAVRPWSAYDLTGYMRSSAIRRCWARTESRLYAEPKNLVAHGLAEASTEYTGRRSRTVYRITDKGRSALGEWLGEPSERPELQDEILLKILLSDHGTPDQLLTTIRSGLEHLRDQISEIMKIADRIVAGEPRFPERMHVTALASQNGIALLRQRLEFLTWANDWVRTWKDTALDDEKREAARRVLARNRTTLQEIDRDVRKLLEREG